MLNANGIGSNVSRRGGPRCSVWGNNLCLMPIFFPRLLRFDVKQRPAISSTPHDLSYFPRKKGWPLSLFFFLHPLSLISACVSIPLLITDNTCALFHRARKGTPSHEFSSFMLKRYESSNYTRGCWRNLGIRSIWIQFSWNFTFLKEEEEEDIVNFSLIIWWSMKLEFFCIF